MISMTRSAQQLNVALVERNAMPSKGDLDKVKFEELIVYIATRLPRRPRLDA
jgi:hypothetical protein